KARSADLFIYLIYQLSPLEHISKCCKGTGICRYYGVTDQVVGNTCQLHDDDTHIVYPLRCFDTQQLLYSHVPAHIVDGRRAVVEPVCKRCDLIIRAAFCYFFERTVDITDSRRSSQNYFTDYLQYVMKDTMR